MKAPSETDPLEFFLSENDLPGGPRDVPKVAAPAAVLKNERRGQRPPGRRLVAAGSLAVSLVAGIVWLVARPTPIVDGAAVNHQPARITRETSAPPADPARAVARPLRTELETAPGEFVLPEPAELAASDAVQPAMLSLGDSGVGTDVVARQLRGRSVSFPPGSSVVFWTLVLGGRPGEDVRHVWLRDGKTVSVVTLPIGSPEWRTYSRLRLDPDEGGNWVVEARDSHERVLARHQFLTEPPS